MNYTNILPGIFCSRPNRFIAEIEIDHAVQRCHVKNTGRCKELLRPGAKVFVQKAENPNRSTAYDLISVYKGKRLVNIDSQAPNKVFGEWLQQGNLFPLPARIKPETRFGNSRMDFYAETDRAKYLIEVKGVTLEENGIACFPDAPTTRGIRHLRELICAKSQGYEAAVAFVIQMKGIHLFRPNWRTHPEFGKALQAAAENGVRILALDCIVTKNGLTIDREIPVSLKQQESHGNHSE